MDIANNNKSTIRTLVQLLSETYLHSIAVIIIKCLQNEKYSSKLYTERNI